ncbi:type IV pilus biogenesis/stability protein PilW [Basfia succiniciproducens]|uniref:Type IV pilus assembly protein PilF n=1 Tax=Basfia succiniciproducens TaxID=653940 RepID=A0A1G5DT88_9PAST|nr:type IV pilus biogenesis/stability protein PilW [Basfia succiniciproducens]QIM69132.1 type IV pilus biogenesis/stability protein PilW [Basfia succiniciproducens]SCY17942.1 type IV pilus assembly protein PilF [Basfia succiniciproducens]
MTFKFQQKLTALFSLFISLLLSACSSSPQVNAENLAKQQAAKARIELGLAYLHQQNINQAKQNFDKALEHAPQYYLTHSALAYFHQQLGNVKQARIHYQKAIDLDNNQGDVHNNYGTFLCSQGQFEQAYDEFEQALQSPNYYRQTDSYENLALCALSAKNNERFQRYLAKLEKLDPKRAAKLENISN